MSECTRYQRLAIHGAQVDPTMALVGSTPYVGDITQTGIALPAAPTGPLNRYLCVCCGLRVGINSRCIIRHLRQLLTIGTELSMAGGAVLPVEVPVTSPTWHFVDGAVSWHLRMLDPTVDTRFIRYLDGAAPVAPFTAQWDTQLPAILTRRQPFGVDPYTPQNGGVPFGLDVGNLGTFRDIRYPYTTGDGQAEIGLEVKGPGILILYASVRQTNPEERPRPPEDIPLLDGLAPEDQFILTHPNSRYWRVGGSMIVDLCNPEWEQDTAEYQGCGRVADTGTCGAPPEAAAATCSAPPEAPTE